MTLSVDNVILSVGLALAQEALSVPPVPPPSTLSKAPTPVSQLVVTMPPITIWMTLSASSVILFVPPVLEQATLSAQPVLQANTQSKTLQPLV